MGKYWQNPPLDKKEVRRREEKFPHLRKSKDYKNNSQYLNRFDKSYKKEFDIDNPYQYYSKVSKYMKDFGIYKNIYYLTKNGYFDIDYIGNRKIIPSYQVEEELFRREMSTFRDWIIWDNDKSRENSKKEIRSKKKRTRRFYLILPCGRKLWYGTYDTKRISLAKDVAAFLLKNIYIFEPDSEYYLKDSHLRQFVREKMSSRLFERIDIKEAISAFKVKMLKKNK
jgi:hypothetical protein